MTARIDFTKSSRPIPIAERQHRYEGKKLEIRARNAMPKWLKSLSPKQRKAIKL